MLDIALVGCGGSMPVPNRFLTSMMAAFNGSMMLIDCGEGTQVSLKMLKWGFKAIDIVAFTHYHGDHIIGFPGLLLTLGNSGRTEPLNVLGPPGLKNVINGLRVICPELPFELNLVEISADVTEHIKIGEFSISTLPVEHSLPCLAYKIEALRTKKFNREKAESLKIPMKLWNRLQKGEEIEFEGKVFTPDMVLGESRKGLQVCYCTDSRPQNELVDFIKGSELLICEGMYGDDSNLDKAIQNKHMLFSEAAMLAREGAVDELWLTHFSPSLTNPEDYLENARKIFINTLIGQDRMVKNLIFSK